MNSQKMVEHTFPYTGGTNELTSVHKLDFMRDFMDGSPNFEKIKKMVSGILNINYTPNCYENIIKVIQKRNRKGVDFDLLDVGINELW